MDGEQARGPVDFDLDAYCARINYTGSRDVSLDTLKALHFSYVHAVPFENLDIHLGVPISLTPIHLFDKIVRRKRGGYCYEVNSLFAMALQSLGFDVQCLLGRVLFGFSDVRPRSHQLLLVTLPDGQWIADVGFGSCCLRYPLPLSADVPDKQGPDTFRLAIQDNSTYLLRALLGGRWQNLYSFSLEPFLLVDFEPYNYWNSTSREVRWTQQKVCSIPTRDGRVVSVDREFKIYGSENVDIVQAKTEAEYVIMLRKYFGLEISGSFPYKPAATS